MKKILFIILLSLMVVRAGVKTPVVLAVDPVDELQQQIDDLAKLKKLSEDATKPLESELKNLESRINNARKGIADAKQTIVDLAKDIDDRELKLATQYQILSIRVADQYKRARTASPLMLFLSANDASRLTQDLAYRASIEAQDKILISEISTDIEQLEADTIKLEKDQVRLASLEKQLDEQADFFRGEIAGAKEYQQDLAGKIAALSAQQQAIINARSGTYTTAVGDVPLADDFNASIGYKAQAPSNSFAIFSFGGYTHRNGMSQYGAKARADAGQDFKTILSAYYPGTTIQENYPAMGEITVQGVGGGSFEDWYLKRIYEVPASWPKETLKAQAIAARTYAIRYTGNGARSICTTEACQVFKNSPKGGEWEAAVNETKGMVLVKDGEPALTQYASTHGGYTNTAGWDTTDGSGSGNWTNNAWEKKAPSPWFYKSWYRSGYSSSGPNCGRSHPWLSQEEFSDIINAWIVRVNPNGADTSRIQPVTINDCNIGGSGGNPYSMNELKDLANNSGGAVTSVSNVSVSHNSQGQTATVTVNTNRGTISIPGSEFKSTFNLRAPGYISIPQSSFAFFNVEHKQ